MLCGNEAMWSGGIAHSMLILALVIAMGVMLGKIKVAGVSLGVTGILFVGIIFSHFGMTIDADLMHFMKEFGLILFVYSTRFLLIVPRGRSKAQPTGDNSGAARRGDNGGTALHNRTADNDNGGRDVGCGDKHPGTGCSTAGIQRPE